MHSSPFALTYPAPASCPKDAFGRSIVPDFVNVKLVHELVPLTPAHTPTHTSTPTVWGQPQFMYDATAAAAAAAAAAFGKHTPAQSRSAPVVNKEVVTTTTATEFRSVDPRDPFGFQATDKEFSEALTKAVAELKRRSLWSHVWQAVKDHQVYVEEAQTPVSPGDAEESIMVNLNW